MLILLNRKRKGDGHLLSGNKGAKVGEAYFEDTFLMILIYWPSFHLSGTGVSICRKDHVGKSKRTNAFLGKNKVDVNRIANNPGPGIGIIDKDKEADNLGIETNIADVDRKANNLGTNTSIADKGGDNLSISIVDVNRGINNLGKDIANRNREKDNPSIRIIDIDRRVDKPGTSIEIDGRADNPGTRITKADELGAASNKTRISLFLLCKAFLFWSFLLN